MVAFNDIDLVVLAADGSADDDAVVNAIIDECDGDPRAAIRALLRINQALMRERRAVVSRGYVRSRAF